MDQCGRAQVLTHLQIGSTRVYWNYNLTVVISIDPKVPIMDSTSWHVPIEELEPLKLLRVFKNPKRLIETSHLRDDF